MATCKWCNAEMLSDETISCHQVVKFPDGKEVAAVPHDGRKRCHDCNVAPGGLHHPGCDKEECPRCGGQLIGCGCLDEDEDDEF